MRTEIGKNVTYVDSFGHERHALVTNVFKGHDYNNTPDSCNVVVVNDDAAQTDTYGNKIERFTSVCHKSVQSARGNYWF